MSVPTPADSDRDGLSDAFEQALLTRFCPRFMVSVSDCDTLPAAFRPGLREPRLLAKNGTIYGQVFPTARAGKSGAFVEIHYYHLWSRDCGTRGHDLDAEHVSVLIHAAASAATPSDWKAEYWYAAAHKSTVCDASHAAHASVIGAQDQGPAVWISGGKHGSFLSPDLCRGGCGGDSCEQVRALPVGILLNIGERGTPMNGALWVESSRWRLAGNMVTDFPVPMLAQLEALKEPAILPVNESKAPLKALVLAGTSTTGALATADRKTGAALSTADTSTGNALDQAAGKVGRSVKRAFGVFWGAVSQ